MPSLLGQVPRQGQQGGRLARLPRRMHHEVLAPLDPLPRTGQPWLRRQHVVQLRQARPAGVE
jgi:hypothetical protein